MALVPESLEVGDKVYLVRRYKMGNTTLSAVAIEPRFILSLVYWDYGTKGLKGATMTGTRDPGRLVSRRELRKLFRFHPKPVRNAFERSPEEHARAVERAAAINAQEKVAYRARVAAKKAQEKEKAGQREPLSPNWADEEAAWLDD